MDVKAIYGNFMRVDGRVLTAEDSEQLEWLLAKGKQFIVNQIEALETKMRADNPNRLIQPPRVWVMYLGPREEVVHEDSERVGGDIFRTRNAINEAFWPFWDLVVASVAFKPEVRWSSAVLDNPAGVYLLVGLR